ncbi:MAG: sugar ABC transporter permease [Candidatus Abyssobacteria bacterium SURF_17]|uniref:Sugar ABC transporter permease n=1 Tax=Candidatus Abyssobacteria bacterium SURF_17 TaxID=2093361 RepID=A0A419EXZ1_9BACT|nr:MAG: sugar ABC transporter permease [Candidatus Abyssubacteria bacterium SURF_17]
MRSAVIRSHTGSYPSDTAFHIAILIPAILLCAFTLIYPALLALHTSLAGPGGTVSLNYYSRVVTDKLFLASLTRTIIFAAIAVFLEFVLGFAMALLMVMPLRGRSFFRTSLLVPWVLPPAVIGLAWRWIFYEDYGIVNDLILRMGIAESPIPFLRQPHWAFATVVFTDMWKTAPFVAIILLAGLSVIPQELYEAAAIDGAGRVRRFSLITLPMLTPYILTALLFRSVHTLGIFDLVWVLTGGGPSSSTEMLSLYITKQTFRFLNVGYGAALSVTMFVITIAVAVIFSFLSRRRF